MQAFEQLEIEWGNFIGNPNCVACATGSAALHLSLETLKKPAWNSHARCVVPEFTMVACARAVVMADMQPVFVDCDEQLLMQLNDLPTWNVRAIQAVHIYGRHLDMDVLANWAMHNDVVVIEDMAEITGVKPSRYTDAACWSFYKNKIIHGEEGGMIAFKNPEDAAKAKQLRSLGFTEDHDYMHIPRGHNYRLSNVHAELILRSLALYEIHNKRRRQIEDWYNELVPKEYQQPKRDAVWVYDIRIPGLNKSKQDEIVSTLNSQGIAVRYGFKPMSMQPEFRDHINYHLGCINAFSASQEVIYFPVYPNMAREDVERNIAGLLVLL